MAILNFEHLYEQADRLILPPAAGPPRQVDLRRAVSPAYYALFHFAMTRLADQFVGVTQRSSGPYALFYRSVGHRQFRELCLEVRKEKPSRKFADFIPTGGWGASIKGFTEIAVDLQERRHTADYDPRPRIKTSDAKLAIGSAKSAVRRFQESSKEERLTFLTLLVCPPR